MGEVRTLTLEEKKTSTAHRLSQYDGACENIHGHNLLIEVRLDVEYDPRTSDHMTVDFKRVDEIVDEIDHALLLSVNDPLVETLTGPLAGLEGDYPYRWIQTEINPIGEVILFDGDPTTEHLSGWFARRFVDEIDVVNGASVEIYETEKYGMEAEYELDEGEE